MSKVSDKKLTIVNKEILRIVFFMVLSACYMVIYMYNGEPIMTNAIDGSFHFSRILGIENILQSPINFNYFNHNGIPVNMFYPWLTVSPMYLLIKLTHNILWGYYIYGIILSYLTLEISYFVGKKITKNSNISILFAIVYTFALTRTTNLYCRAALGEVVAMTFLPIIFLGIYRVFYDDKPKFGALTLGMTLVVYTHMISFFISVVLVAVFLIIRIFERKLKKQNFIALMKATGITIALTLAVFFPILQYFMTTKIEPPLMYNLMGTANSVSELLTTSLVNQVGANDALGLIPLALLIIAIIRFKHLNRFYKDSLIVGIIFTILATKLVPWDYIQPLFQVVQFPWRFLVVSILMASFVGVIALYQITPKEKSKLVGIGLIVIVILTHFATLADARGGKDNPGFDQKVIYKDITKNLQTFNGSQDYRPKDAGEELGEILQRHVKIGDNWYKPSLVSYTANTITYKVTRTDNDSKKAIIPVYAYPGEQVVYNGKEISVKVAKNGCTEVPIKKGYNKYEVTYHYTTFAKVGFAISGLTLIAVVGTYIYRRFTK